MTQVQEKFEKLNSRSEMEIQFEDHFSENKEYLVRFNIILIKKTYSYYAPLPPGSNWSHRHIDNALLQVKVHGRSLKEYC